MGRWTGVQRLRSGVGIGIYPVRVLCASRTVRAADDCSGMRATINADAVSRSPRGVKSWVVSRVGLGTGTGCPGISGPALRLSQRK